MSKEVDQLGPPLDYNTDPTDPTPTTPTQEEINAELAKLPPGQMLPSTEAKVLKFLSQRFNEAVVNNAPPDTRQWHPVHSDRQGVIFRSADHIYFGIPVEKIRRHTTYFDDWGAEQRTHTTIESALTVMHFESFANFLVDFEPDDDGQFINITNCYHALRLSELGYQFHMDSVSEIVSGYLAKHAAEEPVCLLKTASGLGNVPAIAIALRYCSAEVIRDMHMSMQEVLYEADPDVVEAVITAIWGRIIAKEALRVRTTREGKKAVTVLWSRLHWRMIKGRTGIEMSKEFGGFYTKELPRWVETLKQFGEAEETILQLDGMPKKELTEEEKLKRSVKNRKKNQRKKAKKKMEREIGKKDQQDIPAAEGDAAEAEAAAAASDEAEAGHSDGERDAEVWSSVCGEDHHSR